MFNKRWRIGSLLGFAVEVNLTFLLLLGAVFLWKGLVDGVFVVAIAFASVLAHELGHAVVARALGVRVSGIELHFFGGAAKMIELPRSANHEIAIAAAGPAVSLILAGLGLGLGALVGGWFLPLVGVINLLIALFNLLPALPMDGGRILRALLTRKYDFVRATDISVTIARGFAIAFAVLGVAGAYQLLLLAPILWFLGSHERQLARQLAHRFVYDRDGYTERRRRSWFDDEPPAPPPSMRRGGPRFVIRQRNGRMVIEVSPATEGSGQQ